MIQLLYFIPHIIDTIAASMSHQPAIEGDPASGLLKKLSECAETPSSQACPELFSSEYLLIAPQDQVRCGSCMHTVAHTHW